MLDLKQIESFYPDRMRPFKRNLLREYLQCKILEAVFLSEFAERVAFMGGTAIHIVHANTRFSEDLDFDNLGLRREDFERLTKMVQKRLGLEGYEADIRNSFKEAYRSRINIANVLYENGLSAHKEEMMSIHLDAEPQRFSYKPDKIILNKFEVFIRINVVPLDVLLSQKIFAIFKRKRPMGRDFYDAIFLFSKTKPSLTYLKEKLSIESPEELKRRLMERCESLDFKQLSKDVEHFLFNPADAEKVLLFCDYIKQMK